MLNERNSARTRRYFILNALGITCELQQQNGGRYHMELECAKLTPGLGRNASSNDSRYSLMQRSLCARVARPPQITRIVFLLISDNYDRHTLCGARCARWRLLQWQRKTYERQRQCLRVEVFVDQWIVRGMR